MGTSTTRAPVGAQNRLDRARLALRLAEERTGLRDSAALTVQRALSSASTNALLSASADSPQAGSSASPAPPAALSACQDSGVLTRDVDPGALMVMLMSLTGWWSTVPQVARMLCGSLEDEEAHERQRAVVVDAARRLAAPRD